MLLILPFKGSALVWAGEGKRCPSQTRAFEGEQSEERRSMNALGELRVSRAAKPGPEQSKAEQSRAEKEAEPCGRRGSMLEDGGK